MSPVTLTAALRHHWPEYLIEAAAVGVLMVAVSSSALVLFHPGSPVVTLVPNDFARHALMGLAMGGTAIALVYSPWGKQSGAHFNPAVTLTYWRLGKIARLDAMFYILFQFAGGMLGMGLMVLLAGRWLDDPQIHYVTTMPRELGPAITVAAELVVSFAMMTLVLGVSNRPRTARFTGLFAGSLVAINVALIVPFASTSLNPARSLASAVPAGSWAGLWIYLTAAPLAMLLAARCYVWRNGRQAVFCAKLHHDNARRCIFCEYRRATSAESCNPTFAPASERVPAEKLVA